MDGDSPSVTDLLGAAGACPEVRHDGKTWKVGHPTNRAKTALEQLAVAQAVAEVSDLEKVLPAADFQKAYKAVIDRVTARHYKTWGPGWQEIVWGPMGGHLFFLSLLREHHENATEDDATTLAAEKPIEVGAALTQVLPNFVRLLLNLRKDLSLQQREKVLGQLTAALEANLNPQPPAPTPATSADSSPSGAKHSRKSRGATTPTKSPA